MQNNKDVTDYWNKLFVCFFFKQEPPFPTYNYKVCLQTVVDCSCPCVVKSVGWEQGGGLTVQCVSGAPPVHPACCPRWIPATGSRTHYWDMSHRLMSNLAVNINRYIIITEDQIVETEASYNLISLCIRRTLLN